MNKLETSEQIWNIVYVEEWLSKMGLTPYGGHFFTFSVFFVYLFYSFISRWKQTKPVDRCLDPIQTVMYILIKVNTAKPFPYLLLFTFSSYFYRKPYFTQTRTCITPNI